MSDKKKLQLGMNPSTASGRLVKDLLWDFIVKAGMDTCIKCGEVMTRETFSIEHVSPWLDSDDPVGLFFDVDNIAYSHLSCNIADRRANKNPCGSNSAYLRGCRCRACKDVHAEYRSKFYTKELRRKKYEKHGY